MSATVGSVEKYCSARAPFTSSTKPSASAVAGILLDAEAEVVGILIRAGYDYPIPTTATAAVLIVDSTIAKVAVGLIERTAPTRDSDAMKAAEQMAESAKTMLAKGELPGVAKNIAQSSPRGSAGSAMIVRDMAL